MIGLSASGGIEAKRQRTIAAGSHLSILEVTYE